MLARGLDVQAAEALARLFRTADLHADTPPVRVAMHLALRLHAKGEVAPAVALTKAVVAWLRQSGEEARLLRGNEAALWALVRELSRLPETFSPDVRTAIARAAHGGDLSDAVPALRAERRHHPQAAIEAAAVLRSRAPTLAEMLAAVLEDEPPPGPPLPPLAMRSGFLWLLLFSVLVLVGVSIGWRLEGYDSPRTRVAVPPLTSTPFRPRLVPPAATREQVFDFARGMEAEADFKLGKGEAATFATFQDVERHAEAVYSAIERDDCTAAWSSARLIDQTFAEGGPLAGDAFGRARAQLLAQAVGAYCQARARRGPTGSP